MTAPRTPTGMPRPGTRRRRVLDALLDWGELSASEIAQETAMGRRCVTEALADLVSLSLVEVRGARPQTSGAGRPARLYAASDAALEVEP